MYTYLCKGLWRASVEDPKPLGGDKPGMLDVSGCIPWGRPGEANPPVPGWVTLGTEVPTWVGEVGDSSGAPPAGEYSWPVNEGTEGNSWFCCNSYRNKMLSLQI